MDHRKDALLLAMCLLEAAFAEEGFFDSDMRDVHRLIQALWLQEQHGQLFSGDVLNIIAKHQARMVLAEACESSKVDQGRAAHG